MGEHVLDGGLLLLVHVSDFAHLYVLCAFAGIVDRVKFSAEDVLRAVVVSKPQLQSQYGPQRNEAVKVLLVATSPGNGTQDNDSDRKRRAADPLAALFLSAVGQPPEQEREKRNQSCVGHQRKAPQ